MSKVRTSYTAYEAQVYKDLKAKYGSAVVSPSHLRIDQKVLNAKQAYDFPILPVGNEIATEIKLDKNDLFRVTRMGLHIFQRNFVTANEGAQPLQQYPNQTYFTTGTAWVKTDLETVYNGKLAIKRGSTVILESFSTRNFREVADTQQSAAGNYSSSSVDSGMVQLVPAFDLPGREQVSIQATFPTFTGILWQHDLANTENRIALVLQGFLVKGANI